MRVAKFFFLGVFGMKNALKKFWNDEAGFVVTVEMILVATVLVIGLVSGLTLLRDAILGELSDTAASFGNMNQGYAIAGESYVDAGGEVSASASTLFTDAQEVATDGAGDATDQAVGAGLLVTIAPLADEADTAGQ
jgi:Flp pilus assembly pilin Flp